MLKKATLSKAKAPENRRAAGKNRTFEGLQSRSIDLQLDVNQVLG